MNEFIIVVLIVVGLVLAIAFLVSRYNRRKTARKARLEKDKQIEQDLFQIFESHGAITKLAQHSKQDRIARIVAERILEYLKLGVSPGSLALLFERLSLDNPGKLTDKEKNLAVEVKNFVHLAIDDFRLDRYKRKASQDLSWGFDKLKKSFLVQNVKKNGFVMNLQLS